MSTPITYVGPESQGPHYLESGKRPAPPAKGGRAYVVAQRLNGDIIPMRYDAYEDAFIVPQNPLWKYAIICWWPLPPAAPMTEREWFERTMDGIGYSSDRWRIDVEWQYRAEFRRLYDAGPVWFGEFRTTHDEAITDAYNHWVEAGRP